MTYQDGEIFQIINEFFNDNNLFEHEDVYINENIKRKNKIFLSTNDKFIKVNYDNIDSNKEMFENIVTINNVFKQNDFYQNVNPFLYKDILIQISEKLYTLYDEFGNGEWDSKTYHNETLLKNDYLKKIYIISKKIWDKGYIHNDLIKSIGLKDTTIKIFDIECMMTFDTFKTTWEYKNTYNSILEHDHIFNTNYNKLFVLN